MRNHIRQLYEFGPYCLDAEERRLTCAGKSISLAPKVLDTLVVLVENSGRVLEKEELLKTLWPDTYVEESNLTTYVSQLRKALGEASEGQSYIETVPRRGYRFVATVKRTQSDLDRLLMHERTDVQILIEEEINDPDPLPETTERRSTVTVNQPVTDSTRTEKWNRTTWFLMLAVITGAFLLGVGFLGKRAWMSKPPVSPFQRMTITKLTSNGKIPLAAISPDGKYVAYVQREMSNQSLWVRQTTTTSNVSVIAPAAVRYLLPTFSPDGNYIYYVTYAGQMGTLFQVPALGGTPRKIIEDVDSAVSISPDGKKIVFIRNDLKTKDTVLMLADADGQNLRSLVKRPYSQRFSQEGMSFYAPAWSPDGKFIACAALEEEAGQQLFNVIRVAPDTGQVSSLTDKRWHWVGQIAWLPDSSGLVANALDQGTSTVADQIWHIALPSGATTRVTNDTNSYMGLSIAAKTGALVTIQSAQISRMWIMPVGNEQAALPITSGFGENYSDFLGVAWTRDGRVVYGSNASGNADIWIMDSDGKNQKQLTTATEKDMTPVVSPDNSSVVYISFQGKIPHIMQVDLDGSNLKQLTNGQGEIAPTYTPDGQSILYTGYTGEKQAVYKLPLTGGPAQQITGVNFVRAETSPDGRWIVAIQFNDEGARKIAIMPTTGGPPVKVIENLPFQKWSYLRWFPDSRSVTVVGEVAGVGNIYRYALNAASPQKITNFKSDLIYRYAWSPDGKMLAVERGVPINDVVLISGLK